MANQTTTRNRRATPRNKSMRSSTRPARRSSGTKTSERKTIPPIQTIAAMT
jgi:hypothetical protein